MTPKTKVFFFLLFLLLLIVLTSIESRAQILEIETLWPGSMHSDHVNQCNPDCAEQDNGGSGFLLTLKGIDKFYNIGFGRVYFTNSFGDPGLVDILQLAEWDFEYRFFRGGIAVWKMWIYGYYNQHDKPVIHASAPWPVFNLGFNPAYHWTDNFFVSYQYVNFIIVSINFITISYRVRF